MKSKSNPNGIAWRRWLRVIHRDLSFFFAGVIIVYAVSGLALNHKRSFNADYKITRTEMQMEGSYPHPAQVSTDEVQAFLRQIGEEHSYMKHYYFGEQQLKVFLNGGSSLTVDMNTGKSVYESVKKRPVLSAFTRLHYNPNRWWTVFSDVFAVALLLITASGLLMNRGRTGLWGRGGIELILGIVIPLLFLLISIR